MPVLQTTIRDCRLKSLDLTYSQRSQQRERHEYFITSGCATDARKAQTKLHSVCRTDRHRVMPKGEQIRYSVSLLLTGLYATNDLKSHLRFQWSAFRIVGLVATSSVETRTAARVPVTAEFD